MAELSEVEGDTKAGAGASSPGAHGVREGGRGREEMMRSPGSRASRKGCWEPEHWPEGGYGFLEPEWVGDF